MTESLYIAGFIACVAIIVYSGSRLSKYGDMLADLLGWGKMFMGFILMAFVTSLPELVTGISSVAIVDAPDIAVGDIVGSCAFNILIISIMDLFYDRRKPLTSAAETGHVIAASFSIILLSITALAIVMPEVMGNIGWIGGYSFIFLLIYLAAIRIVFLYEKKHRQAQQEQTPHSYSMKQVLSKYTLNAIFVMGAAMALPFFGERLAAISGLGQSFFSTLFIAGATSLPEIVVSVAAIRLGTINMAIGNIFGSNIFNIGILALDDIFYTKGPLLSYTSPNHIIPIMGTIIITAIGISGIVYKPTQKWRLAIDTALIMGVYILMMGLLYSRIDDGG